MLRVRMADHGDAARVRRPGASMAHSMRAGRAGARSGWRARIHRPVAQRPTSGGSSRRSTTWPFFRCESTISSMSLLVHIGVPDGLGVDHGHRTAGAAVQAAGLVDTHAARTGQAGRLDARLAAVEASLGIMLRAGGLAVVTLVQAEEDVVLGNSSRRSFVARWPRRNCRQRAQAPQSIGMGRAQPTQQPDHRCVGPQPADP